MGGYVMELIENLNFIEVWVKAGTSKNEVILLSASSFKIYVTSTPKDGRANKKAISLLAKFLRVDQKRISIIQGEDFKNKIFKITP
jgi:uncharacterized protein YggU (UPF0235/DUF167 family)